MSCVFCIIGLEPTWGTNKFFGSCTFICVHSRLQSWRPRFLPNKLRFADPLLTVPYAFTYRLMDLNMLHISCCCCFVSFIALLKKGIPRASSHTIFALRDTHTTSGSHQHKQNLKSVQNPWNFKLRKVYFWGLRPEQWHCLKNFYTIRNILWVIPGKLGMHLNSCMKIFVILEYVGTLKNCFWAIPLVPF